MSTAQSHFQNSAPSAGIWHSLNRLLGVLIVLLLITLIAIRFVPEISKRRVQLAILEGLKAEVEKERQKAARFTREEEMLRHDPEFLGMFARDRLDLMRDEEKIYRFESSFGDRAKMRLNR